MTIKTFLHKFYFVQKIKDQSGQAVVELAVMFPVILIIALIAVNALTFFSECSLFDRSFKQIVSCTGTSPAYGKTFDNLIAQVKERLSDKLDKDFLDFDIFIEAKSGGFIEYNGILIMHPTLFGIGLKEEIFGVPLPCLSHQQKIVIEEYKPGVIF